MRGEYMGQLDAEPQNRILACPSLQGVTLLNCSLFSSALLTLAAESVLQIMPSFVLIVEKPAADQRRITSFYHLSMGHPLIPEDQQYKESVWGGKKLVAYDKTYPLFVLHIIWITHSQSENKTSKNLLTMSNIVLHVKLDLCFVQTGIATLSSCLTNIYGSENPYWEMFSDMPESFWKGNEQCQFQSCDLSCHF